MEQSIDFNDALKQVNGFGLYQKLLCAFLVVPSAALSSLVYLTQFMILLVPENHWCHIPDSDNLTSDQWKELAIKNTEGAYEKCSMFDLQFENLTDLGMSITTENRSQVYCQYGWDYDFSSLYPTIATELNWVCDDDKLPYWSQTIYYFGTSIGSFIFGFIADRFGRRPSIVLSYLITCVASTASAFTHSFAVFSLLRFFVGACIIPLSEDAYVLGLEYIGMEHRTLAIVFWSFGYIVFSCICPWLAYSVHDWRMLTVLTSLPLALFVIACKWIPESASWLLMQGRHDETVAQLSQVARINKRSLDPNINLKVDTDNLEEEAKSSSFVSLFRTPRLRKHSLILAASWFVTYCSYHTNVQNTSNLSSDVYESFTFGALVEAPVMLFILLGVDRFGRRGPMVAALALAALAGILLPVVPKEKENWFLLVGLVQRLGIATNYNIIMQYSAEIYPTVLRGRGLAFLRLMGTFGLYFSPSLVYMALEDASLPLLVCGAMSLVLALLTFFLPETVNRHLPHTMQEGETFGQDQKICTLCTPKRTKEEACEESLTNEDL